MVEITKKCTKCGVIKPFNKEFFYPDKRRAIGLQSACKECVKRCIKEYVSTNKDVVKLRRKEYRQKNKDSIRATQKEKYYTNHEEERRKRNEYCNKNKEKISKQKKKYALKYPERKAEMDKRYATSPQGIKKRKERVERNRIKFRESRRNYDLERRKIDPVYKTLTNTRTRINRALKDNYKNGSTVELLGCTIDDLKAYLESQFVDGMSWDNHTRNGWHIDHFIPCSSFDMSDPIEQKKCFHFTNLQPLWAKDNLEKKCKVPVHE